MNPRLAPKYPLTPEKSVLLGIDFQQGFGPDSWEHTPHAESAVANFAQLARSWRKAGGKVIHVHVSYRDDDFLLPNGQVDEEAKAKCTLWEGSFNASFYPNVVEPEDILIRKNRFSAVAGSNLLDVLRDLGYDSVIVGGLTTPICVGTTVDGLSMARLKVTLLSDCCASQPIGPFSAEIAHDFTVERIKYLFGQITTSTELLDTLRS